MPRRRSFSNPTVMGVVVAALSIAFQSNAAVIAQDSTLTPLQSAIRLQQNRLSSADAEERRDAIMRLGSLRHVDASRAAVAGLSDVSVPVRVAAVLSVLSLPSNESAGVLIPLLKDKDEFVRQETAYALGKTGSPTAAAALIELLGREKKSGVRGAIVVSLGQLRNEAAVVPLVQLLGGTPGTKLKTREQNLFVLRSAATALGNIKSRAAVPALIAVLENKQNEPDLRREAARALGEIGDVTATPVLRATLASEDPYLSLAAEKSLRQITSP